MSKFHDLKIAVQERFNMLAKTYPLYQVKTTDRDDLVNIYLNSFQEGEERQYYNCNCCKSFLRQFGNIVAIDASFNLLTIWDVETPDELMQQVANNLKNAIVVRAIENMFLIDVAKLGTNFNIVKDTLTRWEHFYVELPKNKVFHGAIGTKQSEYAGNVQVFGRSLKDITPESCEFVLEMIDRGNEDGLYRGAEFRPQVRAFLEFKNKYDSLNEQQKDNFVWSKCETPFKFRDSSIGALCEDISEGMDEEKAVRRYDVKTAPSNYKRTSAIATPKQIEQAKAKVVELGFQNSLQRRYAVESDIPVADMLYVDRKFNSGDVFDMMKQDTLVNPKKLSKVEEISLESFISNVLPNSSNIELLLEGKHTSKFMVLTSAVDKEAPSMFSWDNDLAWAYTGDVTDSMKERVKIAGGRVEGDLCCRLAWDYTDDLDFHMKEPGGYEIYFGNLRRKSPDGGILDTDANGMDGMRPLPIENIVYENRKTMKKNKPYELNVNNYSRRSDGIGFGVEMEFDGQTHSFSYNKIVRRGETITVAKIILKDDNSFEIIESLEGDVSSNSKDIWNIGTNKFHKVRLISRSPNFLTEEGKGNKHTFFILENCKSPEPVRGFYNEYLHSKLYTERKVFEMLGAKLKVPDSDKQLAGLGFSETQEADFIVKVTNNSSTKTYKVKV